MLSGHQPQLLAAVLVLALSTGHVLAATRQLQAYGFCNGINYGYSELKPVGRALHCTVLLASLTTSPCTVPINPKAVSQPNSSLVCVHMQLCKPCMHQHTLLTTFQ